MSLTAMQGSTDPEKIPVKNTAPIEQHVHEEKTEVVSIPATERRRGGLTGLLNQSVKNVSLKSLPRSSSFFLRFVGFLLFLFILLLIAGLVAIYTFQISLTPSAITSYISQGLAGVSSRTTSVAAVPTVPATPAATETTIPDATIVIHPIVPIVIAGTTIPIIVSTNQPNTLLTIRITEEQSGTSIATLAGKTDALGDALVVWTVQAGNAQRGRGRGGKAVVVSLVAMIQGAQNTSNTVRTLLQP